MELLFLVIISIEFKLDVNSNKLEWNAVSYVRKLVGFTKGFHRLQHWPFFLPLGRW